MRRLDVVTNETTTKMYPSEPNDENVNNYRLPYGLQQEQINFALE